MLLQQRSRSAVDADRRRRERQDKACDRGSQRVWPTSFPGGVHLLSLAPLTDSGAVATALAHMLGLRQTGGKPIVDALLEHVKLSIYASTLLVLDNFEHVLAAAPLVASLIESSPDLKILVTSRAVLHVSGEHEYPVPPLAGAGAGSIVRRCRAQPRGASLRRTRAGREPCLPAHGGQCRRGGGNLPPARRSAAGDRACRAAVEDVSGGGDRGAPGPLARFSHRRSARSASAPADTSQHARLEPRAVERGGAEAVSAPCSVRGRLHARRRGSGVQRGARSRDRRG